MPKITINEKDYTGSGNSIALNQTVLVPGNAAATAKHEDGTLVVVGDEFEIRGSSADLIACVGELEHDLGFDIAKTLLDIGMTVLYVVVAIGEAAPVAANTTESESWWKKFEDKSVYELRFLTTGRNSSALSNALAAKTAAARGDSVALIYIPRDIAKDYSDAWDYINTGSKEQTITEYETRLVPVTDDQGRELWYDDNGTYKPIKKEVEVAVGVKPVSSLAKLAEFNDEVAKYAATFVPNFALTKSDGSELPLPGYVAYLGCFATYVNRFASWFAFAGATRGLIPWRVKFDANFGELAIDKLQDRSTAGIRALNPICNIRNYGDLVWGNRTLWPVSTGKGSTVAGLTASSFLNIRMLVSDIKNHLYNVARAYTFDPNSSLLWTRFYNSVVPLLEDMKTNQGIRGYKLTQVKDTKKATLTAVLRIIPIEAVEDFEFTIELADSLEITEE